MMDLDQFLEYNHYGLHEMKLFMNVLLPTVLEK